MYDARAELLATYRATPEILRALVRDLPDATLRSGGEGEDAWSVVEVVCHLRDAEEIALGRILRMRDEHHPSLDGYDQAALAVNRDYISQPLAGAVKQFSWIRGQAIDMLSELDAAGWQRTAALDGGSMSIQEYIAHRTMHDAVHLAQIARRVLSAE